MKKTGLTIFIYLIVLYSAQAQGNQEKAQELVRQYLDNKKKQVGSNPLIKFNSLVVLRSSFADTKTYKYKLYKVDSLKKEGRRIDARIARMKTTAELNQAKKDSYRLSSELTNTSNQLIDFMTSYKGTQTGWLIKSAYRNKNTQGTFHNTRKTFYLNEALTKVDSVR